MTGISTGKAIGYATLPGIFPRIRSLFFSGFGNLAYFIALAYSMVRLLPEFHPYLNPENIGKYGIRHVVAAAMHELKFEWKYVDQIVVFFAMLAGIACLLLFGLGLVAFVLVSPVMAMSFFITTNPETDIAFMMMDKIFGLPGMFMSEVETNPAKYGAFPNNFHVGMRSLFQFYSMGLFLLSVFVLLYYVVVVVTETAMTGTPFGKRFDNVWIPLRVIAALALLMPGFGGYSSAQYIVLYAAKFGSGLATNTWVAYNLHTGDTPVGGPMGLNNRDLIPRPAMPDYTKLIKDLIVIRGCMEMYTLGAFFLIPTTAPESFYGATEWLVNGENSQPLLDVPGGTWPSTPPRSPVAASLGIPWTVTYHNMDTFETAENFYNGGNIRLVLGTKSDDIYSEQEGHIYPHCGEIVIPIAGRTPEARYVAEGYLAAVIRIIYSIRRDTAGGALNADEDAMGIASAREFHHSSSSMAAYAQQTYPWYDPDPPNACYFDEDGDYIDEFPRGENALPQLGNCEKSVPPLYWASVIARYQQAFEWAALSGYDYLTGAIAGEDMEYSIGDVSFTSVGDPNPMLMDTGILRYGWGGAGLWYNKIAEKNGSLASAIGATPYIIKYPDVMEKIKSQRLKADSKVESSNCEIYNPRRAADISVNMPDNRGSFAGEAAKALYELCTAVHDNNAIQVENTRSQKNPNMVLNIINALFGADTFFNLLENREVHPMSMLATLGRTLIDKAIFNLAAATGTSVIGGLNQIGPGKNDPGFAYLTIAASNFSHAFVSFGMIALVSGVMLYYVMPFMPFLYFFFAVGRWVKTIFEAMVGVPLWALAHLSLKGPGLPSPAANAGYFLILEIFIRPVLTVFALVAAFSSFAALVMVLNSIFELVVSNIFGSDIKLITTGTDPSLVNARNLVDQFFLTVTYVLLVYIIGTSCFKLIDILPDNIMRWSGAGVKTWGGSDNADELVDNFGKYIAMTTYKLSDTVGKAITSVGDAAADDARDVIQAAAQAAKKKGAAEAEVERIKGGIKAQARGEAPSQGADDMMDAAAHARSAGAKTDNPAQALTPGASKATKAETQAQTQTPAQTATKPADSKTNPQIDPRTGARIDPRTGLPITDPNATGTTAKPVMPTGPATPSGPTPPKKPPGKT